jgi:periplasmic protein CpxP/Spy
MRKQLCGIFLGTLLAVTANMASAQTADSTPPPGPRGGWGHGPMNPAAEAEHMAKRLNLTSEQQTQVESILTSEQTQMKALNENTTITHQQWLAQTKALHQQTHTQINGLLTDTQKALLAQHRGPGAMGDHEGPPAPEQ